MARESWFYDELWPLHGISVARYYGWYEAEIDSSIDIWGPNELNVTSFRPLNPFPPSVDPETYDHDDVQSEAEKELPKPWGKQLAALASVNNRISILLLERLEAIPLGEDEWRDSPIV